LLHRLDAVLVRTLQGRARRGARAAMSAPLDTTDATGASGMAQLMRLAGSASIKTKASERIRLTVQAGSRLAARSLRGRRERPSR
jgi:hypothetical protein